MTKDYAKHRLASSQLRSKRKAETAKSTFLPFAIVLALALGLSLGFGGAWFSGYFKQENKTVFKEKELDKRPLKPATKLVEEEVVTPPRFDFYTLLPTMEVNDSEEGAPSNASVAAATPPAAESTEAPTTAATTPEAPTSGSVIASKQANTSNASSATNASDLLRLGFIIQAGSFRNQAAAEKLKAKLAFKGVISKIEPSAAAGGETWYRVVIGPLQSQNEAKTLQSRLHTDENLNSLALRVRV